MASKQPYYAPPPQYGAYGSLDGGQPQYAPPPGPPPPQQGSSVTVNQEPKYQDLWASILFCALVGAFVVLAVVAIPSIKSDIDSANPIPVRDAVTVLIIGIATATVLSAAYYQAMIRWPAFLIKTTFYFAILSNFLMAAFFFYSGQFVGGIIWVVLAIIFAFIYWSWRNRIPFAVLMLENVLDVIRRYPSVFVVAGVQLLLTIGWTILWSITVIGLTIKFSSTSNSGNSSSNGASAPQIILWVFSVFSMYWVAQVISNVGHVTVAGLYATFYFLGIQTPGGNVDVPVRNPVMQSFKRATTTSFGSICFGSLIIAIIQTLRAIADNAKNENARDGNIIGAFIAACLACLLQMLGDLVEYFNVYAFAEVAIYGKSYCQAAKDTWELVKRKGVDAIINDNLVGNVLGMGTLLVGVLTAAVGAIYVAFSDSVKNNWYRWAGTTNPAGVIAIAAIVCLMFGMAIFGCVASLISSGIATTFVCLAEDPHALMRTKPALFQAVQQVYPSVNYY